MLFEDNVSGKLTDVEAEAIMRVRIKDLYDALAQLDAASYHLIYTTGGISHKIQSFMQKLRHHPSYVSNLFHHSLISYLLLQK